jgi:DNA-binding transcriptional LysR family regulator
MNIDDLEAFLSVAKEQSFSRASKSLFITQPAVSKRVAALENEVGLSLFNRIKRQVSLTEAGKQLLPKAQELVDQAVDLKRFASSLSDSVEGRLAFAISHHIGLYRLPPVLQGFSKRYPNVQLAISFNESEQACQSVERGDIEFAVITIPKELPKDLTSFVVWQEELRIVCNAEHPLARSNNVNLEGLSAYPCVMPTPETETFQVMERAFNSAGLVFSVQMATNNLESLKMLAATGIGWALLPESMIDGDLKIVEVNVQFERYLGIVRHQKRSQSNAAKAMQELILAEVKD